MGFVSIRLCWWHIGIAITSAIALYTDTILAQITPDATLPNNSNVTLEGNTFNITGGSTAGGNLFHSFKDFSIPTGSSAFFNNAVEIQNIISRVTGNSISNIDGLIKANGAANLFLINPNGIIFGQNARLEIGGSFLATSASSIKFGDSFDFSAVNTESKPLLTVTAPVGLQFGEREGLIQVQGNGQGARDFDFPIIDTQSGLRVQADKTLALVGGDINLEGATLLTEEGRIELGSVAGNNLVSLTLTNFGFALSYSGVQNFGNIQLSQRATVDAGDLTIKTDTLLVETGAKVNAQSSGTRTTGNLTIGANSINLDKNASLTANTQSNRTDITQATININSRDLILRRASSITTNGNININTDVFGAFKNSEIIANSNNLGGNISIKTQGLFLGQNSSIIASGASPSSGNINITTTLPYPNKDLVPLTVSVVDVARLVDDNICARTAKSSFTYIGRGGIPSSPDNPAVSNFSWEDWRLSSVSKQQQRNVTVRNTPVLNTSSPASNQIVEAQSWMIASDGNVILTSTAPVNLPPSHILSQCHF